MKTWRQYFLVAQIFWLAAARTFAAGTNAPTDNSLIGFAQKRVDAVRITQKPFQMDEITAGFCDTPPDIRQELKHNLKNPHRSKYVHVYVSASGKAAMLSTNTITFPVGSIILKEKFSDSGGKNTELFTGMVKRERGFNPECGDWEFFTLNSDASKLMVRGKLANCMSCHADYKDTDFVTKAYVNLER